MNSFNFFQTINSILKLFSEKRLEDFNIRWNEVFKDRVEDLEVFLNPKFSKKDEHDANISNDKLCVKDNAWITRHTTSNSSNIANKLALFNDILFIEKLDDPDVEISIEKKECHNGNKINGVPDELVTLCITVTLKEKKTAGCTGDGLLTGKTFVICRTSVESAIRDLDIPVIKEMLVKKIKKILKNERLQLRKTELPRLKQVDKADHQSLSSYYPEDFNVNKCNQSKGESNVVSVLSQIIISFSKYDPFSQTLLQYNMRYFF